MLEELLIKIKAALDSGGFDNTISYINAIEGTSGAATSSMKNDLDGVENTSSGVWASISNSASAAWSSISNGASSIRDSISNAFAGAKESASEFMGHLQGMEGMMAGVLGGLGVASVADVVINTSAKAETNKILLKNMTQTKEGADALFKTVDNATNKTLVSMQQVIPALNAFKAATGANEQQLNKTAGGVSQFGSFVYAMSGSAAKAETAMFDLSKGIKGAYASLDQYGITEDSLMNTGLWSGKADDVEGYIKAVNAVTGSTDELMGTFTGIKATIGKVFSIAGKQIGQDVLPVLKDVLNGFIDLNKVTGGNLTRSILLVVGGLGALVSVGFAASSVLPLVTSGFATLKRVLAGFKALATGTKIIPPKSPFDSGLAKHSFEVGKNTALLEANTVALKQNNIARAIQSRTPAINASQMTPITALGGAGTAAAGAAPGVAAGATGFAAIGASITSMLVPLLTISAVVAIMIPIIAGIVIEIIAFVRLIGEVIKWLAFDKLNLKPAIEGIKQIGLAMWEIGKAFAAMTLVTILGIIQTATGGFLVFIASMVLFVAEVKTAAPLLNQLNSVTIDKSVGENLKRFTESMKQIMEGIKAIGTIDTAVAYAFISPLSDWTNNMRRGITALKNASKKVAEAKGIDKIDDSVRDNIKSATESIVKVGEALDSIGKIDKVVGDSYNNVFSDINLNIPRAMSYLQSTAERISKLEIPEIPENLPGNIKKTTEILGNISSSLESIGKIDKVVGDAYNNVFSDISKNIPRAMTFLQDVSNQIKDLKIAEIPKGLGNQIQRVAWTLNNISTAINSMNTLPKKIVKKDVGGAVEAIKKAEEEINKLDGVSVSETASGVVNSIKTIIDNINSALNGANVKPAASNMGKQIVEGFKSQAIQLKTVAGAETDWAINAVNTKASAMWTAGAKLGTSLVGGFKSGLNQNSPGDVALAAAAEMAFTNNALKDNLSTLFDIGRDAMNSISSGFGSGVNSGSAGDLANAILAEMKYGLDFIKEATPKAYTLAQSLGESIVSGFGTPTLAAVGNDGFEDFSYPNRSIYAQDSIHTSSGTNVTNHYTININNPVIKDEGDVDEIEYQLEAAVDRVIRTT